MIQPHRALSALLLTSVLALAPGCDDAEGGAAGLVDTWEGDAIDAVDDADATDGPPTLVGTPAAGTVRAGIVRDASELIGGPKAEGELGDLKIENAQVRFVVEGARFAGGYRNYGGHVIDADVARPAGEPGGDRFGELMVSWNLTVFVPERAEVLDDGTDGVARLAVSGHAAPYAWPDSFLTPIFSPDPVSLDVRYEYSLGPDDTALRLDVTIVNTDAAPADVRLPLLLTNHGDGAVPYAPGAGFSGFGSSRDLSWFGAIGRDLAYGVMHDADDVTPVASYAALDLLLMPSFVLAPGASHRLTLWYAVGTDGTSSLERAFARVRGDAAGLGAVAGTVTFPAAVAPRDGWVVARARGAVEAIVPIDADGAFAADLPPESYELVAYAPGVAASTPTAVEIAAGSTAGVDLVSAPAGVLRLSARDADGAPVPAQLTVFRTGDTPAPWAPDDARFDDAWGHDISAVGFALPGETLDLVVPPGTYRVVASRGFSYTLDEAPALTVTPDGVTERAFTLTRVVDTTGWAAADFHIHGRWSQDSNVAYETRMRQAAANDVTLPILSEHAYIGDARPTIAALDLGELLATVPAQEVTTFEYGHFNAFPLAFDADAPSHGAVFEHGHAGTELFAAIRAQGPGDRVIQVNHPRGGDFGSYFDTVGLDAVTGAVEAQPERWTEDWELLEVFNGRCVGKDENDRTLADWFAMNDRGFRRTLSSGSDSHAVQKPIGVPRSWVQIERAAVAAEPEALLAPLRERRAFVSCGPFVRFATPDGVGIGGRAATDEAGEVRFDVVVEAPPFLDLAEVRLYENGAVVARFDLDEEPAPPADPARPALRFEREITAHPARDAWYVVEVVGRGDGAPVAFGQTPYAMTNPIEVDADGDGAWTPPAGQR
ncbi:MAG: carboxypeptidase regulatory-like domain-containing protein [Deltaproteobacteria bacterium]|nr:MAG: carboxypeptidase regulatory-like domain-containing protein [Deltaproteobacteria bacterium]